MLFIVFEAGAGRYALAATRVTEVLPAVSWVPVAGAAVGVVGIFNYHGTPVPVVDAAAVLCGTGGGAPRHDGVGTPRLRTRILVVPSAGARDGRDGRDGDGAAPPLVGVLVDLVVGTERHMPHEFVERGPVDAGAPCLGPVLTVGDGVIQRVEPEHLLPESVRAEVLARWGDAA